MWPTRRAGCAAVLLLALVAPAGAESQLQLTWMSGSEIERALGGKTIDGQYSNRRPFTESYLPTGRLQYTDPLRSNAGRWSVENGTFCTIYDNDPTGGCYRVRRESANCFEFYFVARTEDEVRADPDRKPSWTARGWVKDMQSTCQELHSV